MLSRREFSALASVSLASALVPRRLLGARPDADTWLEWHKAAEGAWAALGEGGNTLVVADGGELVIIDTKNPGFAHAIEREARAHLPEAKLSRVINTHHHADHTGGNYAFVGVVSVVAHAAALPRVKNQADRYKERLRAVPAQVAKSEKPAAQRILDDVRPIVDTLEKLDPARFVPTQSVEQETEYKVGERRLLLRHFGPGHTDNDLVVHCPELNLVHTGDLVFNGRHPFVDVAGGATTEGWIGSLRRIIDLCLPDTVVIPGHGAITTVEGVRTQIRYFEAAREAVRKAVEGGATREQASEADILGFESLGASGKSRVLSAIFDEIHPDAAK